MEEYYPISQPIVSVAPSNRNGVRLNTSNIHAKNASGIAKRMKLAGVDWIVPFSLAVQRNDKKLLTLWLRLLPYLVVTQGHKSIKKMKGRASRAALDALEELEGR